MLVSTCKWPSYYFRLALILRIIVLIIFAVFQFVSLLKFFGTKRMNFYFAKDFVQILKTFKFDNSIFKLPRADVLLFCHDVDRGILRNDLLFSPVMDSFAQELKDLNFQIVQISMSFSAMPQRKTWGNAFKLNRYYFIFAVCDIVLGSFIASKKIFFRTLFYKIVYSIVRPKCIVAIGSSPAMCFAGKNFKVKVAEILHGMGITPLPWDWDKRGIEELPDCVLCFDDVSCNTFKLVHDIHVMRIAHPFVDYFRRVSSSSAFPDEWRPRMIPVNFEKEILITLSWGYAQDSSTISEFDNILSNGLYFSEIIDVISATQNHIFWRFRLHPVHLRNEKYSWVIREVDNLASKYPNVEWNSSSNLPLLSVLSTCKGHISMLSTSTYEAALFGVPSLLLCPTLRNGGKYSDMFSDLERLGYVIKSNPSFDGILQWVEKVDLMPPLLNQQSGVLPIDQVVEWMCCPPS